MALITGGMWTNGIKIAFFSPKFQNCPEAGDFATRPPKPPAAEGSAPRPRLWYVWVTLAYSHTSPKLDICTF